MPKGGMRPEYNIPFNSAGNVLRSLYFGARISHQSVGINPRTLSDLSKMHDSSSKNPPNGALEPLLGIFRCRLVEPILPNRQAMNDNATYYHL